jgi:predicted nucleic acid-binding protein
VTFFVDTNILVYSAGASERREPCIELLRAIGARRVDGRTSTSVIEEVWHLELSGRAGPLTGLTTRSYAVFTPLLPVTDETVELALTLDAGALGSNDRIHLAICLLNGIDTIVTADAGFDSLHQVRRVDPLDTRAVARLLRG